MKMASAQVLSNPAVSSRKKDLEAGRRKLEEFRKKKAATKKAVSTSQPSIDDATPNEKQISENGQASSLNATSALGDGNSNTALGASGYDKSRASTHPDGSESVPHAHIVTQSDNDSSHDLLQKLPNQMENSPEIPGVKYQTGSDFESQTGENVGKFVTDMGKGRDAEVMSYSRPSGSQDYVNSDSHTNLYGFVRDFSSAVSFQQTNESTNDVATKVSTDGHVTNVSRQDSDSTHSSMNLPASASELDHSHAKLKNNLFSGLEERKPSQVVGNFVGYGSQQASESHLTGFNSYVGGSLNGPSYSAVVESYPRRTYPSFLDSLNIKDSSASGRTFVEKDKLSNSKLSSSNIATSSAIHAPFTASSPAEPLPTPAFSNPSDEHFGYASMGLNSFEHSLENKLEFTSQKQNEDFAALEQHIEDLTQEKFSLQRSLEVSKTLAESLATENSSLTESYNQQAGIVSQLKAEMERLQKEIKARLVSVIIIVCG